MLFRSPVPITSGEVERLVSEKDEQFTHVVKCLDDDCTFAAQTKYAREAHKIAVAHDSDCAGTALMRHFGDSKAASEAFMEAQDDT